MIYYCEYCSFLFQRMGETWECPYCGSACFRLATPDEAGRLQTLLQEEMKKEENR